MIGIGAVFRDEGPYLKEWIEFHRLVGVEKFFLLNNLSVDSSQEILKPYVQSGIVELTYWPIDHSDITEYVDMQYLAYSRILHHTKGKVKWLALLDIDEFLFSPKAKQLGEILDFFEDFGGVGVNWQTFGTSSVPRIPEDRLLIEMLNLKWPSHSGTNHHIKSIVRPERVADCSDPHFMNYNPGYFQVNTNKTRFEGKLSPTIEIDLLRINHYTLRDEFYFKTQKIPRLQKWWHLEKPNWEEKFKETGMVEDRSIHPFIPKLKKSMGFV